MSKMTDIEKERLDVAEHHVGRLLNMYKAKERKDKKDLERLRLIEASMRNIEILRLL